MEPGAVSMDPGADCFRRRAVELLEIALGPARVAGDCCQWAALDGEHQPLFRLTVYRDGPPALADGWLYIPRHGKAEGFWLEDDAAVERLAEECRAAMKGGAAPPGQRP